MTLTQMGPSVFKTVKMRRKEVGGGSFLTEVIRNGWTRLAARKPDIIFDEIWPKYLMKIGQNI